MPARARQIQEALDLLEQQSYVQRNGEQYEYLTDEEKDVEQEIKNTEVESATVADELVKFVFDLVIKDRKIRYDDNGQDYAFSRKLDDALFGREYEVGIHVISPFHEHAGNLPILRMQSMGRDELLVVLPASDRLVRDLLMYKRTEKYIRQNITVAQQDSVKRILTDRQFQNNERYGSLRKLVEELLCQATLVVSGQDLEQPGADAKTRIVRGFHELLVRAYPNLRMLRGITYTEADIANCLQPSVTLFGGDAGAGERGGERDAGLGAEQQPERPAHDAARAGRIVSRASRTAGTWRRSSARWRSWAPAARSRCGRTPTSWKAASWAGRCATPRASPM